MVLHTASAHGPRLVRALDAALGAAAGVLLVLLLLWVGASVVARYLLGIGLAGADELAIWLHLGLIAVGMPLALGSGLAMRLDVLRQVLPTRGQQVCDVLADALVWISAWALGAGAWQLVQTLGGASPTLGLPEWWRLIVWVPAALLLALYVVVQRLQAAQAQTGQTGQVKQAAAGASLAPWPGLLVAAVLAVAAIAGVPHLTLASGWPPSVGAACVVALGMAVAAPLPHVLLAAAWLALPLAAAQGFTLSTAILANAAVHGMSPFVLLAIPFFLLAGAWLRCCGMAARLVRLAAALVGHWRAGLAQTTLLTSVLFSGASGSSVANAAFGVATFQRELTERGYTPERAGAMIAAASVLDNLIPPSIALLILATATQLPVGRLFVGGAVAGVVMAVCLALAFAWTARRQQQQQPVAPKASAGERRAALWGALPALGLAVIVLLGIRLGVVTTTEAAGLAAFYTLGLNLWQRSRAQRLWQAVCESATQAAAIALLIGAAAPLTFLLAIDGVPAALAAWVTAWAGSAAAVLALACALLLLAGLVLDTGAGIVLLAPLLLPLGVQAGIEPVAFGVVMTVALMIGGLTPPVGLLIFVVAGVGGTPARGLFAACGPYVLALLCALVLLCVGLPLWGYF